MQANDLYFNSDTYRILGDMCDSNRPHKRTHVHPLFVLLINPIGQRLEPPLRLDLHRGGGLEFLRRSQRHRARGGAAVAGRQLRRGARCSSQRSWGFPLRTSSFAPRRKPSRSRPLSIILLFHALVRRPGGFASRSPGIFSFGMLLTNLAVVAITFFGLAGRDAPSGGPSSDDRAAAARGRPDGRARLRAKSASGQPTRPFTF